jgi:hypothetical protein
MIAATIFSLLFVPSFFVVFQGLSEWFGKSDSAAEENGKPAAEPAE